MKHFNFLCCLFLTLLLITSCTSEEIIEEDQTDTEVKIRQMTLLDWEPISPCASSKLKIFIDPDCVGTEWETAINNAVTLYNFASTSVFFTSTTSEEEADISIDCSNFNDMGIAGRGAIPQDDNEVGSQIELNTQMLGECGVDEPCFLAGIVMHELGHNLGIGHNEQEPGSTIGGREVTWVEGTANPGSSDSGSIFNSDGGCDASCSFNDNDITALESLYPCECPPTIRILGPRFLCNIGDVTTYCVPGGTDVLDWNIPINMQIVSSDGNCITVRLVSYNGLDPITAVILDKGCIYEKDLYVNTHKTPNFDITYNGPICLGDIVRFNIKPLPSHQNLRAIKWKVIHGGLNILSSNQKFAVVEGLSSGPSRICATVVNDCGIEKFSCVSVTIQSESNCIGNDDIPNPK